MRHPGQAGSDEEPAEMDLGCPTWCRASHAEHPYDFGDGTQLTVHTRRILGTTTSGGDDVSLHLEQDVATAGVARLDRDVKVRFYPNGNDEGVLLTADDALAVARLLLRASARVLALRGDGDRERSA